MKPKSPEDLEVIKVSYVDGTLSPEERRALEERLVESPEEMEEMADLQHIVKGLAAEKELVFCPPQWRLFEYADEGQDPDESLIRHIGRCSACQERIAAYKRDLITSRPLPPSVREAFEAHSSKPVPAPMESRSLFTAIREYLSPLFNMPVMALGAVAAAILVVVLLYPRGDTGSVLGLSSVTWSKPQGPMIFMRPGAKPVEKPERMAVVLLLKGFKDPLPQDRIDGLYEALTPPPELWAEYHFVEPAKVRETMTGADGAVPKDSEVLAKLHQTLKASQALTVTLIRLESGFGLKATRIDLATGKSVMTRELKAIGEADLQNRLRDMVLSMLL